MIKMISVFLLSTFLRKITFFEDNLILLVLFVTSISLCLAFVLPGHIELIALIFVINLPLLFASTALAPISFMPNWLGWLASLNPLTFAIEPIRTAYTQTMDLELVALHAPYGDLTCKSCISILFSLTKPSTSFVFPLPKKVVLSG